jgi:hypothetical protein
MCEVHPRVPKCEVHPRVPMCEVHPRVPMCEVHPPVPMCRVWSPPLRWWLSLVNTSVAVDAACEVYSRVPMQSLEPASALVAVATWLRMSAMRLLTWNRNYNVKPREISAAQERLAQRLAALADSM